ncbi:RsmB/NOP family class I SAM-dependent RNA methyltransferase [Phaeobacter porticola]|uniref:tRNA and rRNA cytosine-C5-methylase n=1 Tax=Phaeobacter porticola TaxID=1844006 RepID=A0A1L3I4L0_9RHOB|nr:RsmB/NOP family class I SAM-dependent RNA methyltransferase [Phaeobacter porticola]APG46952.1 tRNA and rRNA cytosine-C5-methylase [Phaeobacter porticola]
MTPAARRQAAIEILDQILTGQPTEKELTAWARRSRFAGSKDRAAVRDHVFGALRCLRSYAALGGGGGDVVSDANTTGRQLVLGALRAEGIDVDEIFNGIGHAPAPLDDVEQSVLTTVPQMQQAEELNMPDWLWPAFEASLGSAAVDAAKALQDRAPVHLRINRLHEDRDRAVEQLASEGVSTEPHPSAETALNVVDGVRKLRNSEAYTGGLVELQDAASQAVIQSLPLSDGQRVLDFCAGGGGKSLAMAARAKLKIFAHDIAPQRMKDLPVRAERAGTTIMVLEPGAAASQAPFDLVLCDAPCSGSGSWRRAPEGKWRLTQAQLDDLCQTQAEILNEASQLVAGNGYLAYATCSMLEVENRAQVDRFLANNPGWTLQQDHDWHVHKGTDGFYVAVLTRFSDD